MAVQDNITFRTAEGQAEFDKCEAMTDNEFKKYFKAEWQKYHDYAMNYARQKEVNING